MTPGHSGRHVAWLLALMLLAAVAARAQTPAAQTPSSPPPPIAGTTAERVADPVFRGQLMLYRAGPAEGEPVVLVHGLGQNGARDWSELIPVLARRHAVYALDLPGFGASDKGNHLYSPEAYVRVLDAAVASRVRGPFTLVGHSMGGAIALGYAAAHPQRVARLVLVDPAGILHRSVYAGFLGRLGVQQFTGVYPEQGSWLDGLLARAVGSADAAGPAGNVILTTPALRERVLRGDPNAIAGQALVEHDFGPALRALRVAPLVVWGSEDRVAPLRTGHLITALVPGARLAVLGGLGHVPQQEDPTRFNALLLEELAGRPQGETLAPPAEAPLERVVECQGKSGERFRGAYRKLTLTNCADADIRDARIGRLVLIDSGAEVLNSEIADGIAAMNARLQITGGRVSGAPALLVYESQLDAAGTRLAGAQILENRGPLPAKLRLSVATVERPGQGPAYLHEVVSVAPKETW